MLKPKEAEALGQSLAQLVADRGIGAISKKDYELLVFHHLAISDSLKSFGNYHLANALRVTEQKVKSLRLESSIRHNQANHKAALGRIVDRIIKELQRPEFSSGEVSITLEDPVERREFEHAIKNARFNVEYGINREILKIAPLALFEVILSNVEKPELRFKEVVQGCIASKDRQEEIMNASLTFRQKINKLGEEVSANGLAVSMLSAAAIGL